MNAIEKFTSLVIVMFFIIPIAALFTKWETSEQSVSGIVYNNKNNAFISGNTTFGVRASVDSLVNENTSSTYCLPPNSEYIDVVKKASVDKDVQVVVTTEKAFRFMMPWQCLDNVKVELKQSND